MTKSDMTKSDRDWNDKQQAAQKRRKAPKNFEAIVEGDYEEPEWVSQDHK